MRHAPANPKTKVGSSRAPQHEERNSLRHPPNALGGNFFAGASELLVGPDRAKGGVGATKDAAIHASPKVLTQTVGQIATRMGTTIYAVPGTEVEIGGQTRWATMWERYVAQRVKDLPAFKAAMGGLEDALDGKLLLDGGTYLSMELSCVIGN